MISFYEAAAFNISLCFKRPVFLTKLLHYLLSWKQWPLVPFGINYSIGFKVKWRLPVMCIAVGYIDTGISQSDYITGV